MLSYWIQFDPKYSEFPAKTSCPRAPPVEDMIVRDQQSKIRTSFTLPCLIFLISWSSFLTLYVTCICFKLTGSLFSFLLYVNQSLLLVLAFKKYIYGTGWMKLSVKLDWHIHFHLIGMHESQAIFILLQKYSLCLFTRWLIHFWLGK